MSDAERLESSTVFTGKVFSIERDRVRMPNGRAVTLDVVRHPQSVVLVPVPEPGQVVLVKQYRYAVNAFLWELPAGSVDEGETPEHAAIRECHEEIGQVPATVMRLAALYPTPGYCDEEMIYFRVSGLEQPTQAAALDEDEDIEVQTFELRDAREMVRRGEIVDMKTIVGLGLL
ncbi:MAG: NUDIX hydrolase [Vicinamibacterales bacterium]